MFLAIDKHYYQELIEKNKDKSFDGEQKFSSGFNYIVDGDTANIYISGVMQNEKETRWQAFIDEIVTDYNDIVDAIEKANNDPFVTNIKIHINTPGGTVEGVEAAAEAISNSQKPTEAIGGYMVASAGFWLASSADKITASGLTSQFGSIGVVVDFYDMDGYYEKYGIKHYTITNTDSPNKRPDIKTDAGMAEIVRRLDDIADVFISSVATGRKTTIENVKESFGKGSVFLAEESLSIGMIDNIKNNKTLTYNRAEEDKAMDNKEKTFTAADIEAAKEEILKNVVKHLGYIDAADNKTVVENIKERKAFEDCVSEYADQKIAKAIATSRQEDMTSEDIKHHDAADEIDNKVSGENLSYEKKRSVYDYMEEVGMIKK